MSTVEDARVETRREGNVLVIRMTREAKRNAVDRKMADALDAALNELDDDDSLWAGILTGGESIFCAGSDLRSNGDYVTDRGGEYGIIRRVRKKPLIAAVACRAASAAPAVLGGLTGRATPVQRRKLHDCWKQVTSWSASDLFDGDASVAAKRRSLVKEANDCCKAPTSRYVRAARPQ